MKIDKKNICSLFLTVISVTACSDYTVTTSTPENSSQPAQNSAQVEQKPDFSSVTTKLKDPAFGAVDAINNVTSPKSGSVIPVTGEKIEIAGNYVDAVKKDVASGVLVVIDSKPFVATYGGERPDIAKALNNPKYLRSQFYVSIPTAEIGKGLHEVKIRVIANDMSGYYESDWVGKLDIK